MTVGIDIAWTKMINPQIESLSDNQLTLTQTPEDIHLNHNGDINAGVLFSMTEMAGMGLIVILLGEIANERLVVVKSIDIDFIARAQGPIAFTAFITDEQKSNALDCAQAGMKVEEKIKVEAKDNDGRLVSQSIVTTYIGPKNKYNCN